jgi:predicted dehydrogenase
MIRVAIVGAGIGREHLAAYQQLRERFEVVRVCDVDTERAERVVERSGDPIDVGSSLADALTDDVDLVDVCLPPALHVEAGIAALEADKHLVCEKPVATSLRDVDRLTAVAATRPHVVTSPIFQYRYGLGTAQFRAVTAAGFTGRPFVASVETHWNRGASYYAVDWRGTWATEGGGALLGHAIHLHDLVTAILGPVESVFARVDTRVNDIETEDCASLSLRMENGALVTSSVTLGAARETSRLKFVFDGVTVESDHAPYSPAAAGWKFAARAPHDQAAIDQVVSSVATPFGGYAGQFAAVADSIDGRDLGPSDEPMVTLADGRASVEFVTAAYHSATTGRPVGLPLGRDHQLYDGWLPPGST